MAARSLPTARAEVRTAALAAELLQLCVSGGLLVSEVASAVSTGDGLLFRGSDGVGEVFAVACLCSIPMVSAFAAALLCCAEPSGRHPNWPSSPRSFQVLAALAVLEVIFLCITGAFQPSIHALAWPLALAVCFSRSAVAWSQRFDTAEGPVPGQAVAARAVGPVGPVGARPERPERSKLRQKGMAGKSQQTEVKVKLHFEELNFHDASEEEWREKLLQHFHQDQGISAAACASLQIEFAEGSLVAEVLAPPEAQQALTVLEAPPNPVVLNHHGVAAFASITVYGKGGQSGYSVQRKCAAAMVAMTQVKRLQAQLQTDLEEVMSSCRQSIKDLDGKVQILETDSAEQQRKVQSLEAKSKLQLRLTHNEHLVAPRERVEPRSPEVSADAVAAMAKRLVERTRKDLEAQMAVLQHQFGQVSRELESLSRAAALARAGECDASAVTLRKYLVDALVRPSSLEDAQHLALRLLSQALDAATLLSASALAPQPDAESCARAKAPVEIFAKYETVQETRRLHEELVAERLQELLATSHSDASTVLQPLQAGAKGPKGPKGPKFLPPMPGGSGSLGDADKVDGADGDDGLHNDFSGGSWGLRNSHGAGAFPP